MWRTRRIYVFGLTLLEWLLQLPSCPSRLRVNLKWVAGRLVLPPHGCYPRHVCGFEIAGDSQHVQKLIKPKIIGALHLNREHLIASPDTTCRVSKRHDGAR